MKVRLSAAARTDLRQIVDFILDDNPNRAFSFAEEIEAACLSLAEHPARHPLREDIGPGLRAFVFADYLIVYRVEDEIRIERVLHGRREL